MKWWFQSMQFIYPQGILSGKALNTACTFLLPCLFYGPPLFTVLNNNSELC